MFDFFQQNSEFHHDEFYPGQILSGKLAKFVNATWLEGGLHLPASESASAISKIQVVAKVEKVELMSLGVQVINSHLWKIFLIFKNNICSEQFCHLVFIVITIHYFKEFVFFYSGSASLGLGTLLLMSNQNS